MTSTLTVEEQAKIAEFLKGKHIPAGLGTTEEESAALPAVLAATEPNDPGGSFYGPKGFMNLGGAPAKQTIYSRLTNKDDAKRAWELSERLTDAHFAH